MNPYTGQTFQIGEDLITERYDIGQQMVDMDAYRERLASLDREPSADEREAAEQPLLVAVAAAAHQRSVLGGRELDRRKARRAAAKASRKRNRG